MSIFDSLFRKEIDIIQRSGGSYDEYGKWTNENEVIDKIKCSLQPVSPDDIRTLPENRRQSKAYKIYTGSKLNTVDLQNPDYVIVDNEKYEVHNSDKWNNNIINHFEYIIVKKSDVVL